MQKYLAITTVAILTARSVVAWDLLGKSTIPNDSKECHESCITYANNWCSTNSGDFGGCCSDVTECSAFFGTLTGGQCAQTLGTGATDNLRKSMCPNDMVCYKGENESRAIDLAQDGTEITVKNNHDVSKFYNPCGYNMQGPTGVQGTIYVELEDSDTDCQISLWHGDFSEEDNNVGGFTEDTTGFEQGDTKSFAAYDVTNSRDV